MVCTTDLIAALEEKKKLKDVHILYSFSDRQ